MPDDDGFEPKEWGRTIVSSTVQGGVSGGAMTILTGGADLGLHIVAGAGVGFVVGVVQYPAKYILRKIWR